MKWRAFSWLSEKTEKTIWSFIILNASACLKLSSGLLAEPCCKCCQPIPILPNGKVQRVNRVVVCVEDRNRRTSTFSPIVQPPSNASRFGTTTRFWRSQTGSTDSNPKAALFASILFRTFFSQSTKYSSTRFDPISCCTMHPRLLYWNSQFATSRISWSHVRSKWTNIQITNNIWIPNLKNTWLIYILLKFLCWVLYQIWPTFVISQICLLFHLKSKLAF